MRRNGYIASFGQKSNHAIRYGDLDFLYKTSKFTLYDNVCGIYFMLLCL